MLSHIFSQPDMLVFFVVALVIAITIHEFAHAWVATRLGDPTPGALGRVTLNPLAHMDPMGTLMLFLVGFGWGKPVPYDPAYIKSGRFGEMLIAIAGPISNIIVALLAALPGRIYLISNGVPAEGQFYTFLAVIVTLNIFLAAFNLIPIPPLDGSKILYLILSSWGVGDRFLYTLEHSGPIILLGVILADRILHTGIIYRVLEPIIYLLQALVGSNLSLF